ncbi:MAG: hypothetical protein H6R42_772, partial [Nitrospirae bacterium]|nr:hypothetical protein [Nitrospirota bacterium]
MKKVFVFIVAISILCALVSCAQKGEQKGPYLAKVGSIKITQA